MCACTYVRYVFPWVHMCMLEQVESRGRLGYHSSGGTPFVFLRWGFSLACSSPSRVGWLAGVSQGFFHFCLYSTRIKSLCHYALLKVLITSLRISYMSTTCFDHLLLYSVLYFSEPPSKTSEMYVFFLNVNTHRVYSVLSVCTWA